MMSGIKGKNTRPEMAVRGYLHSKGFRFRLHDKKLPGNPDLVLKKHNLLIFVHGCYWHRHEKCKYAYNPKSRRAFWEKKFADNVERDQKNTLNLRRSGWRVFILWECAIRHDVDVNLKTLFNS